MDNFDFIKGEKLQKQIKFLTVIDEMKKILRRNVILGGSRRENDAEHSWHLAMTVSYTHLTLPTICSV